MRQPLRLAAVLIAAGTLAAGCGGNKAANNSAANATTTTTANSMTEPTMAPVDTNVTAAPANAATNAVNSAVEKDLNTNDRDTNLANGL